MRNHIFVFYFDLIMIQSAHIFLFGQNSFFTIDYHVYIGQFSCVINKLYLVNLFNLTIWSLELC